MNSSPYRVQALKLLIVLLTLSACALADLTPPQGFPPYESANAGYIPIRPQSAFDFSNEQIDQDFTP